MLIPGIIVILIGVGIIGGFTYSVWKEFKSH